MTKNGSHATEMVLVIILMGPSDHSLLPGDMTSLLTRAIEHRPSTWQPDQVPKRLDNAICGKSAHLVLGSANGSLASLLRQGCSRLQAVVGVHGHSAIAKAAL